MWEEKEKAVVSETVSNRTITSSLLWPLIPLQIRTGWGGAPTQPQFVQLQARAPGAGGGGRGSGGRRWGGGGRQPDRKVSRRGTWVPISGHNRSVWGGRGGGGDGDGSISYELWTYSQVLILLTTQKTHKSGFMHTPYVNLHLIATTNVLHILYLLTNLLTENAIYTFFHYNLSNTEQHYILRRTDRSKT